ncbi:hypothetical protein K9M47_03790 [Candidatus Gracilibacteria bacterium]|nr:hypothetical protein [Candidatus Gracilibacteria bacterium]MCF7898449.1 hypothetical protein [Candidatus Paceibacterota bacterium]
MNEDDFHEQVGKVVGVVALLSIVLSPIWWMYSALYSLKDKVEDEKQDGQ